MAAKSDVNTAEDEFRLSSYLHKSSGFTAKSNLEENYNDHSYGKSVYWRPECMFARPKRTLFVHPENNSSNVNEDEEIDVELVEPVMAPVYDVAKATTLMEEFEKHVDTLHPEEGNPDWEDQVSRFNWSNLQARLFHRVVRALNSDRLARLAHHGAANEPVLRRLSVDRTARCLRQVLASVNWKYSQWLHTTLIDNLPSAYLVCYLEALQSLKKKVGVLVERMMVAGQSNRAALVTPNHELVNIVHRRPWDPIAGGITLYKPRKLPQDPILVMVPSGPGSGSAPSSRTHHWMANLAAIGTVVCVYSAPGRVQGKVTLTNCLDHMLASTRAKVTELRVDHGDKPIVLVGCGTGAALACQVAVVEKVAAVICLGFPYFTAEGNRGVPDDNIYKLNSPTLFVVGQNASTCSVDDMEDLRENMNVVTSLVVVGGADDQLRLSKRWKKINGVTQSIVDKCVMDEVGDFLGTLLSPNYVPPSRPVIVPHHLAEPPLKRPVMRHIERKRKGDLLVPKNADELTPPVKRGRKPKVSLMQKMVHNKWAGQIVTAGGEGPRPFAPSTPISQVQHQTQVAVAQKSTNSSVVNMSASGAGKLMMLEKKGLQVSVCPPTSPLQPATSAGSTITVVAASTPAIQVSPVKKIASGQLTTLSSVLQPGSRGVLSAGARTVTTDDKLITLPKALTSGTPDLSELNILDMPVILGDSEEALMSQAQLESAPTPTPPKSQVSPIKFILTSAKGKPGQGLSAIKYLGKGQQPMKILISKGDSSIRKRALFFTEMDDSGTGRKTRIRQIPATLHTQFNNKQ